MSLSETFVSTVLATSATVAGLILAAYALLTPVFTRIVEARRKLIADKKAEFYKQKEKIDFKSSTKEIRQIEVLKNEIDELSTFPPFFGELVFFSFLFCILSFLLALVVFCIQTFSPATNPTAVLMVALFLSGCYLFFGVGAYTIVQISTVLRQEWEALIIEKEEAKRSIGEELEKLEKLSKDVKELKKKEERRREKEDRSVL